VDDPARAAGNIQFSSSGATAIVEWTSESIAAMSGNIVFANAAAHC
jgi:hypothetical protein